MSNEIHIIGVDPSLNSSGICVINESGNILHVESIVPQSLNNYARLCYNYNRYKNIISSDTNIKYVSFEKQVDAQRYNINASSILKLAENIGILKLAIYHTHVNSDDILEFSPMDIKKYATNNGKADKDLMIEALGTRAYNRIKGEIPEHSINDVADAYHCARLCLQTLKEKGLIK